MTRITIAIADDHPMILQGLQHMLSRYTHLQVIATYAHGEELLAGLQQKVPDLLLLDIQMPGKTGTELAPLILKTYTNVKIIALTNFDNALYAHNMLEAGVSGYLLKSAAEHVVIQAIEQVYRGESFLEPAMQEKLNQLQARTNRTFTTKSDLTTREKEILQLIVDGYTDVEIAAKLFLSAYTIKHYRISLLLKLDVKNAAAMVKKAIQMGLVN